MAATVRLADRWASADEGAVDPDTVAEYGPFAKERAGDLTVEADRDIGAQHGAGTEGGELPYAYAGADDHVVADDRGRVDLRGGVDAVREPGEGLAVPVLPEGEEVGQFGLIHLVVRGAVQHSAGGGAEVVAKADSGHRWPSGVCLHTVGGRVATERVTGRHRRLHEPGFRVLLGDQLGHLADAGGGTGTDVDRLVVGSLGGQGPHGGGGDVLDVD